MFDGDFGHWLSEAISFSLSGPLQLLFVGVALIFFFKAAMRVAGLVFVLAAMVLVFGGVTLGDLGGITLDLFDRLMRAIETFQQG